MISSKPVSKDVPAGTVLGMMKGPKKGRNWYDTVNDPEFYIKQSGAGTIALQGTNDYERRSARGDANGVESDFYPKEDATWTDIQAATATDATGTFAIAYEFIRVVVVTRGTGQVNQAWVRWN